MTAATRRIETRGGGHNYKLDGHKVDGVTSIINAGVPKSALAPWAARSVAEYAATNLELLADMQPDERVDFLKGVPWRDRDRAARRGTEVHGYAAAIIDGTEIDVPEELDGHVQSYLKFLADFDAQPILVEAVVGNRLHHWMGTLDLIADLNDGLRWLIDIKTTRSGIFAETAIQLAAYRNAEFYLDPVTGSEEPMIPVDRVAGLWVRADGYDLIPVDASPATYKVFRHAQQIAAWQLDGGARHAIGDTIQPTAVSA